jgi:signal transduction histidine kinase
VGTHEEEARVVEIPSNELLEHLAVGVLVTDDAGNEVLRNSRVDVLLEPTFLASRERLSRRLSSLAQRCQDGEATSSECFESTNGNAGGVRVSASSLADGGTLFTVEPLEISERVNERVRQFVAHMTHDLRTPLTSILGASDLLLSGRVGEPDERHAKLLRIVGEGTQRMASLLSEISARFVAPEDDQ